MKGDFTRSTFQPEKHYTSVRMQQGRLQLDSDWNEQVDIEAYLRHAQSVDMIGADSGVPTSGGDSEQPYRDSFKISLTPDGSDLAIAPGRLYANGTFCELEATPFTGKFTASNRIQVNTLIVDGRQLEKDQWIEITLDNNPDLKTSVQIAEVNNQTLEITLNFNNKKINKNIEQIQQESQKVQLRRVITYNTQPDYIKPEEPLKQDTIYLAYVDVWQRHITAIEDPNIREVALNGSDTTTRTKTVWQIKLKKLDELINEVGGEAKKQLQTDFKNNQKLNNLNAPDWESLIQQVWGKFLTQQEQRQALMNACAKLCSSSGSQSNGSGYQRLENLLYRVEIYEPSQTEQGENQGNNGTNKATFKWSRDNGSIVSPIEKIEGNIITIRKSSQDAWMSSRSGQWLEITNEEMELKGKPGVMVPLSRAFDTKIEFNESRIVNGPIPKNPSQVRLWSHDVKKYPNGAVIIADDWIELETGIKVRFNKNSVYRTGDYWLIPARNATNDIEWPHNQAELQKRQPLPQPPKGIHHDYCSLALIQFDGQVNGEEEKAEPEEQESKTIRDLRIIFPPLMRCLDKAGGIITGTLEIQSDLYVTGRYQKQVDRYVDGKVGIGTKQPLARFHTQAAKPIPGQEKITSNQKQVNLHEGSNFTTAFHEGDLLKVDGLERIITKVEDKSLTINETLIISEPKSFEYQQPIVRLENSEGNPQFVVVANGNTGIGTSTPYNQLDVLGGVAIGQAYAGQTKAPDNGLLVDGTVSIGSTLPSDATNFKLYVNGNIKGNSITAKSGIFRSQENANLSFQTGDITRISVAHNSGNVGIGIDPDVDAKLHLGGTLKLTNNDQTAAVSLQIDKTDSDNWLQFTATNLTGYSFDQQLKASEGIITNRIENYNNESLILQTNQQDRIAIASNGNVGIGLTNPAQQLLIVENGQVGIGYNQPNQSATLAVNGNVGIGTPRPEAQLHVVGTVQVETTQDAIALGLLHDNQSVNISFQDSRLKFIAKDVEGYSFDQPLKATQLEGNSLKLSEGATIEVFSTDSNLLHNSDEAVPTEKAVRTYIDREIGEVQAILTDKADRAEVETEINELRTNLQTYINGAIAEVQTTLANKPDRTEVETQINELKAELQIYVNGAITEVQTTLDNKAKRNGDTKEAFNAKSLNVETSIYSKVVATETINSQTVATVKAVSNGFYQVSSKALKEEINDLSSQEVAAILRTLNPVKFIYTEDESKTPHAGFIAEDTPDLLTANDKQAIKVVDIVAILTKVAQDHRKTLSDVVKIVKKQQAEIAILTEKVKALEKSNEQ